ncbi:MAG TPA: choice-of-anchor tandem repeat GloVer-containing protein [Rhizomicrobium sp.]|jgi:uncharacterized repeat protein (TIGR03803 family)|nr:choice-of-anchor tandem repeat GloVer-containing protein [Rhizomicrobium sp.]
MIGKLCVAACVALPALAVPAAAQTYTTFYSLPGGSGGKYPIPGVIRDNSGNFYGITSNGGNDNVGVVYEVTASGSGTVLHSFSGGADGEYPYGPLLRDKKSNLYGTTNSGGTHGNGVVYKIDSAGNETIIYAFAGGTSDGCNPYQGLIMDKKHNLYGTTYGCGASGLGTVFELAPGGKETVLHSFAGGAKDGSDPSFYGHLLMDKAGDLYGVTQEGGAANDGVLYRLNGKSKLKVLHGFAGGAADGCYSTGTVATDKAGNYYGSTYGCGARNYGIVWEVNSKGAETVLHDFAGGTADGCNTVAGVVLDWKDDIYGNTSLCGASGQGTVWELGNTGTLTLLHSFAGGADGSVAYGELLRTAKGELYGTTLEGGTADYGTVWSYLP